MVHLADSSSILAKPVCKTKDEVSPRDMTGDPLKATCPDCKPCEHAIKFLTETREKAKECFVSIEQIHCHCCSNLWKLP